MGYNSNINELLYRIYDSILHIEQLAIKQGAVQDLSFAEIHTLEAVGTKQQSMNELARELGITTGALTAAMTRLEKKGYVIRKRSENDRRLVMAELTKRGLAMYNTHKRFHDNMVDENQLGLSDGEMEALVTSLGKVCDYLEQHNERAKNEVVEEA